MSDDEEDTVVEEIPVFLSKNLKDNLYVFQYPSRSKNANHGAAAVVNCCVKPVNQQVKVDFALDTESKYYDSFKGEQIASAADGKTRSKNERPSFHTGMMDKLSFLSSKPIEDVSKYVVGILKDGEIHLSPLKGILQLRPSFSYIDKQDKRAKAEQSNSDIQEEEEETRQVKVKFTTSAENDRIKKAMEKSYEYHIKKLAGEPWCETLWSPESSTASELEKQKLFATKSDSADHVLSLSKKKYVEKLVPSERSDQSLEAILPSKVISKTKLKTLALNEQLQTILRDAKMLSFSDIMSILEDCDKQISAEKVLRTLPLVGIVIRGNWVLQSEIMYPLDTVSNSNGVPADLMARGRNYILYKFSKQEYLYRRQVIACTQLPHDEVCEILQSVARLTSEKKWELLLPPDTNFEARYQELVQRQEMIWRKNEHLFNEMECEISPKRVRKRSVRECKVEK